ncbi:MAG: type II toxin-antitoxin system CcdA family antitoxin [Terasakiella sp.]|uniref:type II toxin-antitoxin system CcdA family antitoxin n=1 Tax=unclassified Terasakiella TaxID=2614952 RepID=UPI003AFFE43A
MPGTQTLKKPTNLSLDKSLLAEAKALKINLSHAAEAGLRQAVARAKSECWKVENAAALESSNDWAETQGLPLEKYRQF